MKLLIYDKKDNNFYCDRPLDEAAQRLPKPVEGCLKYDTKDSTVGN